MKGIQFVYFVMPDVKREWMISSSSNVKIKKKTPIQSFSSSQQFHSHIFEFGNHSLFHWTSFRLSCELLSSVYFLMWKGKYSTFVFSFITQRFFSECDAISSCLEITFMTVEWSSFSLSTTNSHRCEKSLKRHVQQYVSRTCDVQARWHCTDFHGTEQSVLTRVRTVIAQLSLMLCDVMQTSTLCWTNSRTLKCAQCNWMLFCLI